MTREERQNIKIIEEAKRIINYAKHWKSHLDQKETLTETEKTEQNMLHWLLVNMPITEKASN
jgi:hypothetical protein